MKPEIKTKLEIELRQQNASFSSLQMWQKLLTIVVIFIAGTTFLAGGLGSLILALILCIPLFIARGSVSRRARAALARIHDIEKTLVTAP